MDIILPNSKREEMHVCSIPLLITVFFLKMVIEPTKYNIAIYVEFLGNISTDYRNVNFTFSITAPLLKGCISGIILFENFF